MGRRSEPDKKTDFEFFWGREGGVPGRGRQRPGIDWPSGLGGVGGRGRASTHGVFSWLGGCKSSVLNPTKIIDFEFFWGRERGGSLVGGDRGGSWGRGVVRSRAQGAGVVGGQEPGGVQGMQGPGQRGEGKHARSVFVGWRSSVLSPTKKTDFEFFWGREGGVPGRGRQRRELGGGNREVESSGRGVQN